MEHNYLKKIIQMVQEGKLHKGNLSLAQILHDDWCGIYKRKNCDCDCEIHIKAVTSEPNSQKSE